MAQSYNMNKFFLQKAIFAVYCVLITIIMGCVPVPQSSRSPFSNIYSENTKTQAGDGKSEDFKDPGDATSTTGDNTKTTTPDSDLNTSYMPYRLKLDTIAFMTCDTPRFDKAFTLFAGAFSTAGGIRLKKYFPDKSSIRQYPYHSSAPAMEVTGSRTGASGGADLTFFGQRNNISLPEYLQELLDSGSQYQNTFGRTQVQAFKRSFGSIGEVRTFASTLDQSYLFAGFGNSGDLKTYQTDSGDSYAHGLSFEVDLAERGKFHVIRSITETDYQQVENNKGILSTPASQRTWNCSSSYTFIIKRHTDLKPRSESECTNNTDRGDPRFTILKNILGDGWNINVGDQCLSLKDSSDYCYGELNKKRTEARGNVSAAKVLYNTQECSIQNAGRFCPHYLSFCVR